MLKKNKENVSTVMLLPVVKIDKKLVNQFYKFGFKNSYLYSKLQQVYNFHPIYLLFEPDNLNAEFNAFVSELSKNPNWIETLDVGIKKILVVFRMPNQFEGDYYTFLRGQYSKLSDAYKKCFNLEKPSLNERGDPKKNIDNSYIMEKTTFYHIFNKTNYLRKIYQERLDLEFELGEDMELYDKVDNKKETLYDLIFV